MKTHRKNPIVTTLTSLILLPCLSRPCPAQSPSVSLTAGDASITGGAQYYDDGDFIGYWIDPKAILQWELIVEEAGTANVEIEHSCAPNHGGKFALQIGDRILTGTTQSTGGWYDYRMMPLGSVNLARGRYTVTLSAGPFTTAPMNVKQIRLTPLKGDVKILITPLPPSFVVPNFHPASCGWLANWSVERNYCANSYLDHLDRVRDDPHYEFVLSECNNMIAILNFAPERFAELTSRVKQGRVEAVNAFFLESTVSLSGGEALAKMGIEGLRWQEQILGVRPRFGWTIDTCGVHDQMPQLCRLLNLDALVYCRCNRTGKSMFWSDSPDGSRILTLSPTHYSDFSTVMGASAKLTTKDLTAVAGQISGKAKITPAGAPVLFLGGKGDYSPAPPRREIPSEFLDQWKQFRPDSTVRFTTLAKYVDALEPTHLDIPVVRGGTGYTFDSFWIQNPRVKTWYRKDEHALQAAETLATIASLKADYDYPVQPFYHSWLQMLLNMDRNTLWGAAGGMVFEHETSWDARDRFEWVEKQSAAASAEALHKLAGTGDSVMVFNPLNWQRSDFPQLPACGIGPASAPEITNEMSPPESIETPFYSARIDSETGAIVSLKVKPSGREMLGGPSNVLVTEQRVGQGDPGDFCDDRPQRPRIGCSSDFKPVITARDSSLAVTVEVRSDFHACRRVIRFNKTHPRIEFTTEVSDLPNLSVLIAEFPLGQTPTEIRRGIPFGFSRDDNAIQGIVPAVRWSDYSTPGKGGVALLDRGLSGREINGNTPIIYLYNATETYYGYVNPWLSGKGRHTFEYAIVAHDTDWTTARVPHLAWEYNCPPVNVTGCGSAEPMSFIKTSDNLIVEVMRREGAEIEVRLVESLGVAGNAEVTIHLPHERAAMTDLLGNPMRNLSGGPSYSFPVRPQQIVTLRLETARPVDKIKPLIEWDELVPETKHKSLREYLPDTKGHPPRGA